MTREDMIEAMARAVWAEMPVERGMGPTASSEIFAQAALSALEAMGCVVMPREPTMAMVEAGLFANENALLPAASCNDMRTAYRAMLAAALGETK
ncbi:hypothetical protein UFOVP406_27 [uncultured Caudovirales phage]|uniref:Uncharacterized protein n=1 Tax=uncultured Caudovirales phage TaxID=2100421 RepID=A0A6J5M0P0_9CAUD|nr:hypothetical protein UFOVP406_27 [uncultured Caudovirales phage]